MTIEAPGAAAQERWAGDWLSALAERGWAVREGVAAPALTEALAEEARRLHAAGELSRAGVGRDGDHMLDRSVRRDKTLWLDGSTLAQVQFLELMETIRSEINRSLYLGLFSYEAHFATYEPGAFYARHVDGFRGARNRVVSTVFYLNPDWREEEGGALAIYGSEEEEEAAAFVLPEAGRLAVFLSEDIPHEVLIARRNRYSIAGWFRVRGEPLSDALAPVLPGEIGRPA